MGQQAMMSQRIVFERPPIFNEARSLFGQRVERAIFSWGDVIYNPARISIPAYLLAHESVHGARQRSCDINEWWQKYLHDAQFRLAEEIPAHREEYRWLMNSGNRADRRMGAKSVAARLSGSLYGRMVSATQAKVLLET